jgi:hypothetical protein
MLIDPEDGQSVSRHVRAEKQATIGRDGEILGALSKAGFKTDRAK